MGLKGKVSNADYLRRRRVKKPKFRLTSREKEILFSTDIRTFYSAVFMQAVIGDVHTDKEIYASGERAMNALHLIKCGSVGHLRHYSITDLSNLRGMGPSALAITADMFCALGVPLAESNPEVGLEQAPRTESVFEDDGRRLAEDLGFKLA